jgi:hypothetical protein
MPPTPQTRPQHRRRPAGAASRSPCPTGPLGGASSARRRPPEGRAPDRLPLRLPPTRRASVELCGAGASAGRHRDAGQVLDLSPRSLPAATSARTTPRKATRCPRSSGRVAVVGRAALCAGGDCAWRAPRAMRCAPSRTQADWIMTGRRQVLPRNGLWHLRRRRSPTSRLGRRRRRRRPGRRRTPPIDPTRRAGSHRVDARDVGPSCAR